MASGKFNVVNRNPPPHARHLCSAQNERNGASKAPFQFSKPTHHLNHDAALFKNRVVPMGV
jgi:hypothetical protein